jgi:hypothetical protein
MKNSLFRTWVQTLEETDALTYNANANANANATKTIDHWKSLTH